MGVSVSPTVTPGKPSLTSARVCSIVLAVPVVTVAAWTVVANSLQVGFCQVDDEIDLRQYIRVLIRYRVWIVGLVVAAAVIAFAVSSIMPPSYEASALVAITGPRYRMQFDSRMQDVPFDPRAFAKGYTQLAESDDVINALLEVAAAQRPADAAPLALSALHEMLTASAVGDGNLVQLTVRAATPELAAALANAWAERYVGHLNALYGKQQDLTELETQVVQAKERVEQADQELAALRRDYGLGYRPSAAPDLAEPPSIGLMYRLQDRTRRLADNEARSLRIAQLIEEAQQIVERADEAAPALVSGLLADMLGLGLFSADNTGLVQINLGDIDARASARALLEALRAKQTATQAVVEQYRGEVAALQAEVAQRQMQLEQLLRAQQVDQNTYLVLSNKLQESRVEADGDIARVAGRAAPPEMPAGRGRLFTSALAAVVAGVVSVFAVFFIEYWRQGESPVAAAAGAAQAG